MALFILWQVSAQGHVADELCHQPAVVGVADDAQVPRPLLVDPESGSRELGCVDAGEVAEAESGLPHFPVPA